MQATTTFDASEPVNKLATLAARVAAAILEAGALIASRVETFARTARPWTDRTNAARAGLTAKAVMQGTRLVIYLFHSVYYGVFLELKNSGRYAIIMRALQTHYPMLLALVAAVLRGVF